MEDLQATIAKQNNEINQLRRENDSLKNYELQANAEIGSLKTEVEILKAKMKEFKLQILRDRFGCK